MFGVCRVIACVFGDFQELWVCTCVCEGGSMTILLDSAVSQTCSWLVVCGLYELYSGRQCFFFFFSVSIWERWIL